MRALLTLGVVVCVACSGGGDDAPIHDTGGVGGSGGSPSGGSAGIGITPTGGSGGIGLSGGVGGTDGGSSVSCDSVGSQIGSCQAGPVNVCTGCLTQTCCVEFAECGSRQPQASCGWGGPRGEGEIVCIQNCVLGVGADGGMADDATIATCAEGCTTPGCDALSPYTSALLACLKNFCFDACFQK
jgi:hypothetical protein